MDRRSLIEEDKVYLLLKNTPYKMLRFITIRDNSQQLMVTVGKAYDYLKRFSDKMWLVKSPNGGIHFHALVVLKPNRKVSFKRGVHIRVDPVGGSSSWDPEMEEFKRSEAEELACEETARTGSEEKGHEVYNFLMRPPSKELQRVRRALNADRKRIHISNIVAYLNKNLTENNTEEYKMYDHYIVKE